jgi:hypothetical protein
MNKIQTELLQADMETDFIVHHAPHSTLKSDKPRLQVIDDRPTP